MSNKAIKVQNLVKNYGTNVAVNDINFEVDEGSIFSLLGTNGAGKTTTIQILIGLTEKTSGNISVLNLNPSTDLTELKKKIGVQLQSGALFKQLTVKEIVTLYSGFYDNPLDADDVIKMVGLYEKKNNRSFTLSGGQLQRLEIALALVTNAEIIFLDEPTTGLDPQSRRNLWNTLLEFKNKGKTIFLTTHFMDEAEILSDKVLIIDNGMIVAEGTPKDLIAEHLGKETLRFSADLTVNEIENLRQLKSVTDVGSSNSRIILYTDDCANTITSLFAYLKELNSEIVNLEVKKSNLEDVFLKLTGKEVYDEII